MDRNTNRPAGAAASADFDQTDFVEAPGPAPDLICLSHLRWDFVYQRPQHLLSRCAAGRRVFFFEEPLFDSDFPRLEVGRRDDGVRVAVPHLPESLRDTPAAEDAQRRLLAQLFEEQNVREYVLWYYTPMALGFTNHLEPLAVVYDCMDELSAFKGAPPLLREREAELFGMADLVFTGGQSLYEAKRDKHPLVHLFPSSIDRAHFAQAREGAAEPEDQTSIPRPRLGFFGVLDERLDVGLLAGLADARPEWQIVIIGPVVKIDPATLPRRPNVHYLGSKSYKELPAYLSGWDVALLLFAHNESTRFISPTKTPEYLAAGCPVVSTSIRDVVRPYGESGLVKIADTVEEFVAAVEDSLSADEGREAWLSRVDEFLSHNSWDKTWAGMSRLINEVVADRRAARESALSPVAESGEASAAGATS